MRFTKIRPDTFERLQLNAGILIGDTPAHYLQNDQETDGKKHVFDSAKALMDSTWNDVLGSTTGGITFEATPTFTDFGEDIDNCPKNMKQLKRLDTWEVTLSGSFVMLDPSLAARLMGSAEVLTDEEEPKPDGMKMEKVARIRPKDLDVSEDFINIWWIGDYGSDNSDETGQYIAIHMWNALSTGGFHLTTGDNEKGTFDFEFTGHYDMDNQERIPFDVFIGSHDIDDPAGSSTQDRMRESATRAVSIGEKTIDGAATLLDGEEEESPVVGRRNRR